ncbi:LysE family translocator [Alteromonas sp. 5E99-2]|uniref:LysE family translocator n=1 Tax=Alteromonas sp. 5E99-2 TaxID=2817683 RepID=UPI001A991922|nr:LysE family translocator [Alteromonas sp. 5E99-2]MBO1256111.1 LysE family translocator [Alteromonas sp. 5E99-2]
MDLTTYLVYLAAIFVLTASPGPIVLLCVTHSISYNFKTALFAAMGSLVAIIGIMSLSFTGLGLVIASSESVFAIIKWLGAGYLVFIGVKNIMASFNNQNTTTLKSVKSNHSYKSAFTSGFLVGATNPKALIFFTALFPQFIDMSSPLLPQYLLLVFSFAVLELSWLSTYAYLGTKSASWIANNNRMKTLNRITGGLFISAGALLLTSER